MKLQRLWMVVFAVLVGIIGPVEAQSRMHVSQRFGIVGVNGDPAADALGTGWEQITFNWAAIQPDGPDDFVQDAVDPAWLAAADDAHREVVGLIIETPGWASETGEPGAVPDGLNLPVDDPENVWAAFVRRLTAEYEDVDHWIIYDEPDVQLGEGVVRFAGSVEEYARLLEVAYLVTMESNPEAVIHLAGLDWWADVAAGREPYLRRLVRVLNADEEAATHDYYFNVVTLRLTTTTQAVWNVVTAARAILEAAGLRDKAIWLETNVSPTLDSEPEITDPLFRVTPDMQADFLVQAGAMSLALGVQRVGVYRLIDVPDDDRPWGLMRADGTRRPAFDAYQTVIDLFLPTVAAMRYSHATADLIVLEQGDRDVYVLWARDTQPVEFLITSPDVGEVARLVTATGANRRITSGDAVWPAAFQVQVEAASRDANGFLTVAGSPRILVLDRAADDFFRVVYANVNGQTYRLK